MKKYRGTGLISEKKTAEKKSLYAELHKRAKAAISSDSATGDFLQYIYSVLVAKNHQKIQSRWLVHEFFFTELFLGRTMCTAILLYLLKKKIYNPYSLCSWWFELFIKVNTRMLKSIYLENQCKPELSLQK